MNYLKDTLLCVLIGILCLIGATVYYRLPGVFDRWDSSLYAVTRSAQLGQKGFNGNMNMIATDVRRNLDIMGGSQNSIRHFIGDPHTRTGMFDTQDRVNELLGNMARRDGLFATQDKANTLLDHSSSLVTAATKEVPRAGEFLASSKRFVDDADGWVVGPTFKQFIESTTAISTNTAKMTGDFSVWSHRHFNPDPYTGNHPRLHTIGVGIKATTSLLPLGADAVRIANGGK